MQVLLRTISLVRYSFNKCAFKQFKFLLFSFTNSVFYVCKIMLDLVYFYFSVLTGRCA
jgi:hypothetical protein